MQCSAHHLEREQKKKWAKFPQPTYLVHCTCYTAPLGQNFPNLKILGAAVLILLLSLSQLPHVIIPIIIIIITKKF